MAPAPPSCITLARVCYDHPGRNHACPQAALAERRQRECIDPSGRNRRRTARDRASTRGRTASRESRRAPDARQRARTRPRLWQPGARRTDAAAGSLVRGEPAGKDARLGRDAASGCPLVRKPAQERAAAAAVVW